MASPAGAELTPRRTHWPPEIRVQPRDTDLLMCVQLPTRDDVAGGKRGRGGRGGAGGRGGDSGNGGNGYSWTTVENQWDNMADRWVQRHVNHHHAPGRHGLDGPAGMDGADGRNGSFVLQVGSVAYDRLYDLKIQPGTLRDSDDGVIEPGELV